MSGGVDSAVAALLLKKRGYDVVGVTLRTWQSDDGNDGGCCDIDDARGVAHQLGIDYFPVNCTRDFQKYVVDPFAKEYLQGKIPNPCIECNKYVCDMIEQRGDICYDQSKHTISGTGKKSGSVDIWIQDRDSKKDLSTKRSG